MSTRGPEPAFTQTEVMRAIRQHDDPFVTATDIAEKAGVSRQTAHKYLQRLHEEGDLQRKKIGGSAVIWWIESDD